MDQLSYYVALAVEVYKWTDTDRWHQGSFVFWLARIYDSLPPIGFGFNLFQVEVQKALTPSDNTAAQVA